MHNPFTGSFERKVNSLVNVRKGYEASSEYIKYLLGSHDEVGCRNNGGFHNDTQRNQLRRNQSWRGCNGCDLQRQDLSVIEEADGYQSLIDAHNYSQDELSQIIGKSRSHIANLLRLRQLPVSVKTMLAEGKLTMGQARPLIGHPQAAELAVKIAADNLSARAVEALIKAGKSGKSSRHPVQKSADIRALELRAQTELGLALSIDWDEGREKGRISVSLTSLEQLDDLLKKLKLI